MLDSERTGRVSVEQLLNLDEFQKLVDVLYKPVSTRMRCIARGLMAEAKHVERWCI